MQQTAVTRIAGGRIEASVDSMGAQLVSLKIDGKEYLWQGDEHWWPRHAPILWPIVGALRNGRATTTAGPTNMKSHGIARNLEHRIVGHADDSLTYELTSSPRTLEAFPFPFRLNMTYRIVSDDTLEQRFEVTNTGEVTLPFVAGGHPAFNVPLDEDASFDDYELRFSRPWTSSSPSLTPDHLLDFGTQMPVTQDSAILPLTHRTFDIDTLTFTDVPDSTISLVSRRSGHGVREDFAGFAYLGVWSAAGDAPFVAIEPWTGCSTALDEDDVFEHKRGMTLLEPGQTDVRSFTITLF
jgi:galactose mutarotase-like enzyme